MPSQFGIISKIFSRNFYILLNIGIGIIAFLESYMFPIAIIKWIVVAARHGGLVSLIKGRVAQKTFSSCFQYKLQLITIRNLTEDNTVKQMSTLSLLIVDDRIQLSYCGQDCNKIPPALEKMYGAKVKCLDLSYNSIETLKGLDQFGRLEELILDNNKLSDNVAFPYLPHLRTLSLNNNQIAELEELMNKINKQFPSLSYLSLLSNKACPNQLSDLDKDDSDYQRYRYFVIYKLPNLRFLDSRRVSSEERREAATRGEFMRVRRPPADAHDPPIRPSRIPKGSSVRPLPVDFGALGKHRGAYGKCSYKYTGKHSEGNRFIVNSDL